MMQKFRPNYRFVVGGFLIAGFLTAVSTPFASGEESGRNISSLSQLAAPELSQAVQNAGKSKVPYLPTVANAAEKPVSKDAKTERVRSGISLPVYSNSFPPMIAQVRTQNWDQ